MPIERLQPAGLNSPSSYHHVVTHPSGRLIHVSGQVAEDEHGSVIAGPDEFPTHVEQAYANLGRALAAAGASAADVVKVTTFVVGYDYEHRWPHVKAAHLAFFGDTLPAWTLVGVEQLATPELLVEVEATAHVA